MAPEAPEVRHGGVGREEPLDQRREGAAHEVEEQEPPVSERVFDVVGEDPEKEHVSREVEESAVQEHRREDRDDGGARRPPREQRGMEEPDRHEREPVHEGFETVPLEHLEDENGHVQDEDQPRDERNRPPRDGVAQGDHEAPIIRARRVTSACGSGAP